MYIFYICLYFLTFSVSTLFANDKIQIDLRNYEKTVYSQNGEDGVIEAIFNVLGTHFKYFVEFGGYDGHLLSNTKLLREKGWQGLLMDIAYENLAIN